MGEIDDRLNAYVEGLTAEERVLIVVRDELYDGSWEDLKADLLARRDRKPHVVKLSARIDEDLARIEKLSAYEEAHGVDLHRLLEQARIGKAEEDILP